MHKHKSWVHVTGRVAAALLGGWLFVFGWTVLAVTAGVALGLPYEEAHTAAMLLAFLLLLAAFCWALAARSLRRVWAVLAGGALLMTAAGQGLQHALPR